MDILITLERGDVQGNDAVLVYTAIAHVDGQPPMKASGALTLDWSKTQAQVGQQLVAEAKGQIAGSFGVAIPGDARVKVIGA